MPPPPRLVLYQQTHFHSGQYISLLPLLGHDTALTHLIISAIHINHSPGDITINDTPWRSPTLTTLWREMGVLQRAGIKVMGMLGGAAWGSFSRLDEGGKTGDDDDGNDKTEGARFAAFYDPLRTLVEELKLDGLDLDIEEEMSLWGVVRLINQLKDDFGSSFIISLAPVAPAMEGLQPQPRWFPEGWRLTRTNLSGFSYFELEEIMGPSIDWYNVQFYCGWGDLATSEQYERIVAKGWDPAKVVLGCTTNERSASGWIPEGVLAGTLLRCLNMFPNFGGVMGWEYWASVSAADMSGDAHHSWAEAMTSIIRPGWPNGEESRKRREILKLVENSDNLRW